MKGDPLSGHRLLYVSFFEILIAPNTTVSISTLTDSAAAAAATSISEQLPQQPPSHIQLTRNSIPLSATLFHHGKWVCFRSLSARVPLQMDHARSANGEENAGIPDDLRCKRSDGKQWRCTAMSMPDKTVCEKHYIQAKKRAANSAMRANLKKAKRKSQSQSLGESDNIYLESKSDDFDVPLPISHSQKKLSKNHFRYTPERDARRASSARRAPNNNDDDVDADVDAPLYEEDNWVNYDSPPDSSRKRSRRSLDANATTEYSDGTSGSSDENGGQTCHQCRRNDRDRVRNARYPVLVSYSSISTWRRRCFSVVKQIHLNSVEVELERGRVSNFCRIPITDYHRRCPNCSYDLCLNCCRDLREATADRIKNP
ncbi:Growth-regulating factor 5 [Spatholobus suberectus]|nr:Growth-regulating factor 5 [Spatholobus suberectus]